METFLSNGVATRAAWRPTRRRRGCERCPACVLLSDSVCCFKNNPFVVRDRVAPAQPASLDPHPAFLLRALVTNRSCPLITFRRTCTKRSMCEAKLSMHKKYCTVNKKSSQGEGKKPPEPSAPRLPRAHRRVRVSGRSAAETSRASSPLRAEIGTTPNINTQRRRILAPVRDSLSLTLGPFQMNLHPEQGEHEHQGQKCRKERGPQIVVPVVQEEHCDADHEEYLSGRG